jgi:hypothetical protein
VENTLYHLSLRLAGISHPDLHPVSSGTYLGLMACRILQDISISYSRGENNRIKKGAREVIFNLHNCISKP